MENESLFAKLETIEGKIDQIDKRITTALNVLYGIDYEPGSRVDRAVDEVVAAHELIEEIRENG